MVYGAPLTVQEISFLVIVHSLTTILNSNNSEIKSVHWYLSLPPNMEWHLIPFQTPYSTLSLCSFVVTLIALLYNVLMKAPSRSLNQVTKRLRLTFEGRLHVKQFQLTDLSLHTLIWNNHAVQVAQPRPRGRPKKSQAGHTSLPITGMPNTSVPRCTRSGHQVQPPHRYISVSEGGGGGGGGGGSGRDLRHTKVHFVCIT